MTSFRRNIEPAVRRELNAASRVLAPAAQFRHLERAHVLGQQSTALHVLAHLRMARWAFHQKDMAELRGQLMRIIGAATKTVFGWVPTGNTGGANVGPFKPLPIPDDLAAEIAAARRGR